MKITNLLFLLILCCLISSCSDDPDDTTDCVTEEFTFLADGNRLEYDLSYLFCLESDRLITSFSSNPGGHFQTKNECFDSNSGLVIQELSNQNVLECNKNLYFYQIGSEFDINNNSFIGDRKVNDSWTNVNPSGQTVTYTVIEKDVTVVVPDGTYVCDKILNQLDGAFNTDTIWFNNKVGYVKLNGTFIEYQLRSKNF